MSKATPTSANDFVTQFNAIQKLVSDTQGIMQSVKRFKRKKVALSLPIGRRGLLQSQKEFQ